MSPDIIKRISEAFEEPFIGNTIRFSEEELDSIYEEVGNIFKNVIATGSEKIARSYYETIVFALVELTRDWGKDEEALYNFLSKKLLGSDGGFEGRAQRQMRQCIDSLSKDNKMFTLAFVKKYYSTLCSHAFAPKSSLFSFFDICWEIYCNDLDQEYSPNDPVLTLIATSFKNKLSIAASEDDTDMKIGSKTYELRVGIIGLALHQDFYFIKLLDSTLLSIHCLLNNEPMKNNTHLEKYINEWWNQKEKTLGREKEIKKGKKGIVKDYKKIRAKYMLEEGIAKLCVPPFRLEENFDILPQIEIRVGEKSDCSSIPIIMGSMMSRTKEVEYRLHDFDLSSITIKITHCNKEVYFSDESLFRDFLIFDGNREVNSQHLIPKDYFLYTPNIHDLTRPEHINKQGKNLYFFKAEEGDKIKSVNRTVFFSEEKAEKEVLFSYKEIKGVSYRKNDKSFIIIEKEMYIDIENDKDLSDLGIRCGTVHQKMSQLDSKEFNNRKRFAVSSLIKRGDAITITVFTYSKDSILASIDIILFNNVQKSYDKDLYYGNGANGVFKIKADGFDYQSNFTISQDDFCEAFLGGEIVYVPPILKWRFDDKEWHTKPIKPIYYKKLANSSMLEIDAPLDKDFKVGVTSNCYLERIENRPIFKIGQYLHSQGQTLEEITIFVSVEERKYELARIFLSQNFAADPIYVNSEEKSINWNPNFFVGEDEAYLLLKILDENRKTVLPPIKLSASSETYKFGQLEENYYALSITVLNERGFRKVERELYHQSEVLFGNSKSIRFKGKDIEIIDAKYLKRSASDSPSIRPIYISNIQYLRTVEGLDCYSGELLVINKYGRRINLDHMKNSSGELVRINPVRIELKTLKSCYLGYGLDIDDDDLEFDGEFEISRDGRTIINRESSSWAVDYFIFKVIKKGR